VFGQVVAGLIILVRTAGWLQGMELTLLYDQLRVAWAGTQRSDRILLVGLTEQDLEADDHGNRRWGYPIPDAALAQLLERLASRQPRAIGVDMYRDAPVPPGSPDLWPVLQRHQNIFWVFKMKGDESHPGIRAPQPLLGTDRAAFADLVEDPDRVLRRALLFADDGTSQYTSLAMALAQSYLLREHISLRGGDGDRLELGKSVIHPLERSRGPYADIDDRGYQTLIDYRGGRQPFDEVSFSAVMDRDDLAPLVRERIVLVGYDAESIKDSFATPFGAVPLAGFAVHAHIVDQLVRAALRATPFLTGLPHGAEDLLLALLAVGAAFAGLNLRSRIWAAGVIVAGVVGFTGFAYAAFGVGWWLPVLPAVLIWLAVAGGLSVWEFAVLERLRRQGRQLRRLQLLASGRELLLLGSVDEESGLEDDFEGRRSKAIEELLAALAAVNPTLADWKDDQEAP